MFKIVLLLKPLHPPPPPPPPAEQKFTLEPGVYFGPAQIKLNV